MNFDASMGGAGNSAADDDEDDADLEAELLALTSGSSSSKPKKGMALLCNCNENNQYHWFLLTISSVCPAPPKVIPHQDLDRMVQDSMKDEEEDDDDSVDENDPDLLVRNVFCKYLIHCVCQIVSFDSF